MLNRRVQARSTIPASMAPSTTSRPNRLAMASSKNSSTTAQRSVVCPVASWPSRMMRWTRCCGPAAARRTGQRRHPTRATEASATKWPRWVRKTAMIRIGNSSPTAPADYIRAELAGEHVVVPQDGQHGAQRRGGQRQPDRHVVLDEPAAASPATTPTASTAESASLLSPAPPAAAAAARYPARNRPATTRIPAPILEIAAMLDVSARPNTCGPISTPPSKNDHLRDTRARQHSNQQRRERGHQRHRHQVFHPRLRSMAGHPFHLLSRPPHGQASRELSGSGPHGDHQDPVSP